jgi:hypothetical protein
MDPNSDATYPDGTPVTCWTSCSTFVRTLAKDLNVDLPEVDANHLIAHMSARPDKWKELTREQAVKLAGERVIIAALEGRRSVQTRPARYSVARRALDDSILMPSARCSP